jgi:hypothetical protein
MTHVFRPAFIGLLVWASPAWAQRPSGADAGAMVEKSRQKALDYARSLPDFVCTEVISRSYDRGQRDEWIAADKLTIKLSYFQQKEEHKLVLIDGKPADRSYEDLEGATGAGEFGGALLGIFDPASQTAFRWESWKVVRRHRVAVYTYAVPAAHSRYLMTTGARGATHKAMVEYNGKLDLDTETGEVLHFTYMTGRLPRDLSLDYVRNSVDYDFAEVGGREYLLPARSETELHAPDQSRRNQIDFRDYRKFSADSTITFGPQK